jgi:UDP-N-acetylmuramoyl-tripeptide--D-alanyl-D-alanine ligase
MRWVASDIAAVVDGAVEGDSGASIECATQDSREVDSARDWMFVPLEAERDGHAFVGDAVAAGSRIVLAAKPVDAGNATVVRVRDTGDALIRLGTASRRRLVNSQVVGITGSVGKTTTKDFARTVFSQQASVQASIRSFNNEIGLPLTLINAVESEADFVILEMGARGIGHISMLCEIGQPTIGIVTTVGSAHTSEFGSVEAVADGKGELVESLPATGLAVLNADVPLVVAMAERTLAQVVTFGDAGDVRAESIELSDDLIPRFRLVSDWGRAEVEVGARGAHLIDNALAVAAAALATGIPLEAVARGLAKPVLSPMRMELLRMSTGARILDDTYNANPLSVAAALRSLAALSANRRIAVLGVMAELGDESRVEHERMARLAGSLGIEVIAVAAPEYGPAATHLNDHEAAVERLGLLHEGDAVLVKGSRVAALEQVVARLT